MEDLEKGADLVIEAELLAKAERAKRRRFTRRGIVLAAIGFIFMVLAERFHLNYQNRGSL